MGKKEEWRPRPFFGGFRQLDELLMDLRDEMLWEDATKEALKKQKQQEYKTANPPSPEVYKKEDKKYKTG